MGSGTIITIITTVITTITTELWPADRVAGYWAPRPARVC